MGTALGRVHAERKGCLQTEQSTGLGGAGIGYRLESQGVGSDSCCRRRKMGRGWEKKLQSLSWRCLEQRSETQMGAGPVGLLSEQRHPGVGLKRLVYITHVRHHALSWL